MATITLTADTLISSLMPSGGGSLASGDTIQLAGYSLIVDADAVSYPVTIANSGTDANLELRDLGRIKLNAALPATVHPYIDPEHPLPVLAEPGIDGDPYRTNLTANARAEIQLNGDFGLGGGAATLPTETREGAFYAFVASSGSTTTLTFDRDFPLHPGDWITNLYQYNNIQRVRVAAYDAQTHTATLETSPARRTAGDPWILLAGGVCLHRLSTRSSSNNWITAPSSGGTLVLFSEYTAHGFNGFGFSSSCDFDRVLAYLAGGLPDLSSSLFNNEIGGARIGQAACALVQYSRISGASQIFSASSSHIGELAARSITYQPETRYFGTNIVDSGIVYSFGMTPMGPGRFELSNVRGVMNNSPVPQDDFTSILLSNCIVAGQTVNHILERAGTIQLPSMLHTPATATAVTWRYTDRTVAPGATLRLRCAWLREGTSETRASVAIADPAMWWPQLWPLGADALASVEFTGGTADWWQQLLTWRNTSTEAATVRVWECVTGTIGGGLLNVEEVKGGQL